MPHSTYDLLVMMSDWLFIIGILGPPIAIIILWTMSAFRLAVSLSCNCFGFLSLYVAIQGFDYEGLRSSIVVALVIGFILIFLPMVEPLVLKRLSVSVNRTPTAVKPIGPLLALLMPILMWALMLIMMLAIGYLPLYYRRLIFFRTLIIIKLILEVGVLLLLHHASLMSKLESRPNSMRWICAFLATTQFHMGFCVLTYTSLYFPYGEPHVWELSMSTLEFLPIGLFLMALKREYVPEEAQRKITGGA